MSQLTQTNYDNVLAECRSLFERKANDYGSSWRVLRTASVTDQIYIKAKRIRTIQQVGQQMVADKIHDEFVGMVNYGIIALIQLEIGEGNDADLSTQEALHHYDKTAAMAKAVMLAKNHDYGEAWREMRLGSLVDLILTKLLRIKQIENNRGKTHVSEGVASNFLDIVNYSIFALIRLSEAS